VDLGGAPYIVKLGLDLRANRVCPVTVNVTAPEGSPPVTSTTLRAVRVQDLFHDAIIRGALPARVEATGTGGTSFDVLSPLTEQDVELIRLRGPVRESLEWTARLYDVAQKIGLHPAQHVERALGLPRTTATKWIRRARDMGLISPTEGSTDGER
jgi:hypothetical protein